MASTLWGYLVGINLLAFLLYGIDKRRAVKNRWRIPESTLLGVAIVGGAVGAWAGMQLFRHKTKHGRFNVLVPLCIIGHILVLKLFIYG